MNKKWKRNYAEDNMLSACVAWADWYFKINFNNLLIKQTDSNGVTRLVAPLMHAASERKATPQAGARLKMKGQRAGFPDIFFPVFINGKCGLFIELKTKRGRLSINQKNWAEYLSNFEYASNCCYHVCRTIDEFKLTVMRYMNE